MRRMRIAVLLIAALCANAHAAEKAVVAPSTDLTLDIVRLDPPDGSTLKAGDLVVATVQWRYSKPVAAFRAWVKPDVPDSVGSTYTGALEETHPGEGRLERGVGLDAPGQLDAVLLVAKDADSHEIYRRRVPVHYVFVRSAEQEALRKDGAGSRITGVTFDPPSPGRLAPGTTVVAHIGYAAKSAHGLRPVAIPVTACAMSYNGLVDAVDGVGSFDQNFTIGVPCALRQVRIQLVNQGGAAIVEKLVDVDLRYGR